MLLCTISTVRQKSGIFLVKREKWEQMVTFACPEKWT